MQKLSEKGRYLYMKLNRLAKPVLMYEHRCVISGETGSGAKTLREYQRRIMALKPAEDGESGYLPALENRDVALVRDREGLFWSPMECVDMEAGRMMWRRTQIHEGNVVSFLKGLEG